MKVVKYKPDSIPEGFRIVKVKCLKCYGVKYFSGAYGMTACEECQNGWVWKLIKIRKPKE